MIRPLLAAGASAALATAILLTAGAARADESTIRHYGDHTSYIFEAEPHAILGFGVPFETGAGPFFGLGFRGTFHIANGFVQSIDDSVGIGFGIDFAPAGSRILVPIVLQWNFWLTQRWSVFGEPGFAIVSGPGPQSFDPFIFYAGARFLFTPRIGLTMRVGYPDASVGVSFLL
jgi:hypothetical protein